jgi:hypothetical protein
VPTLRRHETRMLWHANPGAMRAYLIVSVAVLAEGLALVLGGAGRSSGAAYHAIREIGGPDLVGALLLVLAVMLAVAPFRSADATRSTLIAGCAVHIFLATSFVTSAIADGHAGLLGPIVMSTIAAWFVSQSVLYQIHRR